MCRDIMCHCTVLVATSPQCHSRKLCGCHICNVDHEIALLMILQDVHLAQLIHVRSGVQVCVPLPPWAVRAGARETIYHDPSTVNAAIVTCGGLCPGLNDVVQGLVRKLEDYGVPDGNILGIRSELSPFHARQTSSQHQSSIILHQAYIRTCKTGRCTH